MVRLVSTTRQALERFVAPAVPLALRIVLGSGFLQTGWGKLQHLDRTAQFFASAGIPLPAANALFIGSLELTGGIALLLGLATVPFAALLSSTMVVALATADRAAFLDAWRGRGDATPTDVASFVFLLLLLPLVVGGAGALSADRLLARVAKARRTPLPAAGR